LNDIIFITGTDTGVGKTVLTSLLLCHLRQRKLNALAMKPFCSGGREDVELLQSFQPGVLSNEEVNPFYFDAPLAPLVAAKGISAQVTLPCVLERIMAVKKACDTLLIEGAGGLLVPVAENFFIIDLIAALDCEVILVARNQLGTINHTLLSLEALRARGLKKIKVVMMNPEKKDLSAATNPEVLTRFSRPAQIFSLPYIGKNANKYGVLKGVQKKLEKTLAGMAGHQ
jgi:dethiobiotin synthetase